MTERPLRHCPRCNSVRLSVPGYMNATTSMASHRFQDERGLHVHNPNWAGEDWRCTDCGCSFSVGRPHPCPACDFGHEDERVSIHN